MKLKTGKKSGLKYFDINDIRAWKPCYDPNRYIGEDFRGTAVDILKNESSPFHDRLWVVLRTDLISERVMRLFAVWSARQVESLITDVRSRRALQVSQAFANGKATKEDLYDAANAAYAAYAAVYADAYFANISTNTAAAFAANAAYVSAYAVANAAAFAAANASSNTAAAFAAAAASAANAAYAVYARAAYAASVIAKKKQCEKLIEMVICEGKERKL